MLILDNDLIYGIPVVVITIEGDKENPNLCYSENEENLFVATDSQMKPTKFVLAKISP